MLDLILKILSSLPGLVGAVMGVYNYIHARKEAREQQEKDATKAREERDWEYYAQILKSSRDGYIFIPEDGSEEHKMAERFVARGMLERLAMRFRVNSSWSSNLSHKITLIRTLAQSK